MAAGDLADLMMSQFEKVEQRFGKIEQLLDTKADKAGIDRVLTRIVTQGDKIGDVPKHDPVDQHPDHRCHLPAGRLASFAGPRHHRESAACSAVRARIHLRILI